MLRNNHWRKGLLLILAAMLVVVLAGCGKKKEETGAVPGAGQGKTVATYKDGDKTGTVTDKEFNTYTAFFVNIVNPQMEMYFSIPQMKEQFLREYVGYKILSGRVPQSDRDAVKDDANKFYDQVKQAETQNADLKKKLADAGLTEDVIKYYFTMVQSIQRYEESLVTDAEVKKAYDADPEGFTLVNVRHILVATTDQSTGKQLRSEADALKRAKEVKDLLAKGGDWTKLAKQYSDDTGSKDNGGLYENEEARKWVAEFKAAALKQPIGQVGDPVKTEYGYHVMKVEKRTPQTLDKVKDEIKQEQAQTKLNDFMSKELPKLITKIDLPQEATPQTGSGTGNQGTTNQGTTNQGKTNDTTKDSSSAGTEKK